MEKAVREIYIRMLPEGIGKVSFQPMRKGEEHSLRAFFVDSSVR